MRITDNGNCSVTGTDPSIPDPQSTILENTTAWLSS